MVSKKMIGFYVMAVILHILYGVIVTAAFCINLWWGEGTMIASISLLYFFWTRQYLWVKEIKHDNSNANN